MADPNHIVRQWEGTFDIKTWSCKWTEKLATKECDWSVSSCFTLLLWEEESCWCAIRSWRRLAVEVSSNTEVLSCTVSPRSKKGRRHKLIWHTHTPGVAAPTKHSAYRAEVTEPRHCKTHFNTHVKHILHSVHPDRSPVKYPHAWSTLPAEPYIPYFLWAAVVTVWKTAMFLFFGQLDSYSCCQVNILNLQSTCSWLKTRTVGFFCHYIFCKCGFIKLFFSDNRYPW